MQFSHNLETTILIYFLFEYHRGVFVCAKYLRCADPVEVETPIAYLRERDIRSKTSLGPFVCNLCNGRISQRSGCVGEVNAEKENQFIGSSLYRKSCIISDVLEFHFFHMHFNRNHQHEFNIIIYLNCSNARRYSVNWFIQGHAQTMTNTI